MILLQFALGRVGSSNKVLAKMGTLRRTLVTTFEKKRLLPDGLIRDSIFNSFGLPVFA